MAALSRLDAENGIEEEIKTFEQATTAPDNDGRTRQLFVLDPHRVKLDGISDLLDHFYGELNELNRDPEGNKEHIYRTEEYIRNLVRARDFVRSALSTPNRPGASSYRFLIVESNGGTITLPNGASLLSDFIKGTPRPLLRRPADGHSANAFVGNRPIIELINGGMKAGGITLPKGYEYACDTGKMGFGILTLRSADSSGGLEMIPFTKIETNGAAHDRQTLRLGDLVQVYGEPGSSPIGRILPDDTVVLENGAQVRPEQHPDATPRSQGLDLKVGRGGDPIHICSRILADIAGAE